MDKFIVNNSSYPVYIETQNWLHYLDFFTQTLNSIAEITNPNSFETVK